MRLRNQPDNRPTLIPWIFIATLVLLCGIGLYSIGQFILQEDTGTAFERGVSAFMVIVALIGIAYVWRQRIQMRKTETFRREKW